MGVMVECPLLPIYCVLLSLCQSYQNAFQPSRHMLPFVVAVKKHSEHSVVSESSPPAIFFFNANLEFDGAHVLHYGGFLSPSNLLSTDSRVECWSGVGHLRV